MWESFSVHHDLITHRSEFFRASRSPQWKKPGEPTPLVDEDPSVFALYLHCLCFGTKDLERRIETEAKEEWAAEGDDKATLDEIVIGKHLSAMRFFINLYILSDKLLDPITANLVIDRLINFTETSRSGPSVLLVIHLYASTTADSPLRKLARKLKNMCHSPAPALGWNAGLNQLGALRYYLSMQQRCAEIYAAPSLPSSSTRWRCKSGLTRSSSVLPLCAAEM
jgi:hypothetical protein